MSPSRLLPPLLALPLLVSASASWNFTLSSAPTQCERSTITWSGGLPPHTFTFYSLSGVNTNLSEWTTGGTLSTSPDEGSGVGSAPNNGNLTVEFAGNSTLVIVGSDNAGFATGGTSPAYVILPSSSGDASCLATPPSSNSTATYLSNVLAWTSPAQSCELMGAAFYDLSAVTIRVLIPGGESFALPSFPNTTNATGSSEGWFSGGVWTMPVPEGTEIAYHVTAEEGEVFVSGLETVLPGNTSCLQSGSFGTTGAPYAGAVETSAALPSGTSISEPDTSGSSSGPNVGAIVGGVIGGVAGLVILVGATMFLMRRYNRHKMLARKESFGLTAYDATRPQTLERAAWPEGEAGRYEDEPGPKEEDV